MAISMSIRMKGHMLKQTLSDFTKKWEKKWFVLHNTSSDGVVRIEYYDDEAGERTEVNKTTLLLREFADCRQLPGDKSQSYVFELTSQTGNHVFGCESWDEMESWMEGIRAAVDDDRSKSTKKSSIELETTGPSKPISALIDPPQSQPLNVPPEIDAPTNSTIVSSVQFAITINPNKYSKTLGLIGTYILEITSTHLCIFNMGGAVPIKGWTYRELKTFGNGKDYVEIEFGHSAKTGAGTFSFVTNEAKEVVRVMQYYIDKQLVDHSSPHSDSASAKALFDNDSGSVKPKLSTPYHNNKSVVENICTTNQDVLVTPGGTTGYDFTTLERNTAPEGKTLR